MVGAGGGAVGRLKTKKRLSRGVSTSEKTQQRAVAPRAAARASETSRGARWRGDARPRASCALHASGGRGRRHPPKLRCPMQDGSTWRVLSIARSQSGGGVRGREGTRLHVSLRPRVRCDGAQGGAFAASWPLCRALFSPPCGRPWRPVRPRLSSAKCDLDSRSSWGWQGDAPRAPGARSSARRVPLGSSVLAFGAPSAVLMYALALGCVSLGVESNSPSYFNPKCLPGSAARSTPSSTSDARFCPFTPQGCEVLLFLNDGGRHAVGAGRQVGQGA